ncbi:MAG: glycosyltransferase family 9 protein [Bacteroidota bacterium]
MQNISKILVVRFSSMGDIVLASPLLRILRKSFPSAQIDFLTKEEYADLVRYNPNISSVITLQSASRNELRTVRRKLRRTRYSVLLDLHNSLRSRYIRKYAHVGAKYVVNKRIVQRFFLVNFHWNMYNTVVPVFERYLETAKNLGVSDDNSGLDFFIPETYTSSAMIYLSDFVIADEPLIALAPTAKHATKMWLPERFIDYGVAIAAEYNARLLVFGGADEIDYCEEIVKRINSRSGKGSAKNCAGRPSLLETAALIKRCDLLVSNDTGLMHIGSACGKKLIAIFGSTVKEFGFFPDAKNSIVLENISLDCRPCSHIGLNKCPKGHFRCMTEISVDDLLRATHTLLPVPAPMNLKKGF